MNAGNFIHLSLAHHNICITQLFSNASSLSYWKQGIISARQWPGHRVQMYLKYIVYMSLRESYHAPLTYQYNIYLVLHL